MSHLGILVRRLGLLAGLASTHLSCAKKEAALPPCQEMSYSEQQFTAAFNSAAEKLEKNGYEVRSNLWEDQERFTRLVGAMTDSLGCTLNSSTYQALRQETACKEVKVVPPYKTSIRYCGPGAVSGTDFCLPYIHPGDCLNKVCYAHDLCYDDLLSQSEEGRICAWSEETTGCDIDFLIGFVGCSLEEKCGFGCYLIAAIAQGLITAEEAYTYGSGCLIDERGSCCDGSVSSSPDGGTGLDCFTQYCEEPYCVFSDPFDELAFNTCRWRVAPGDPVPAIEEGALQLANGAAVTSNLEPRACSMIQLKYRSRVEVNGYYFFNLGEVHITYSPSAFPNQLAAACTSGTPKLLEGVDATQWHTLRLETDENATQIYVNDTLKKTLPCGQQTLGNIFILGASDSSAFSVDFVEKKCQ